MKYTSPALLEHLASSYVLGTLGQRANRRFEKLLAERSDIALLVAQWQGRLGKLATSVPTQQPSKHVWTAIAARTRPAAPKARWSNWLQPVGFGLGGIAAGVLAVSALFFTAPALFITPDQMAMRSGEKLPQSYVGLLTDAAGNGKVLVSSLRHGKTMSIKVIGAFTPPVAGRLVLWAVPANAAAFAIGTVPATGTVVSRLPDTSEKLLSKVSKLIVTIETDAAPAAPGVSVFFAGNCAKLW